MTSTSFALIKQCINCFHLNDNDSNTCDLCGYLLVNQIDRRSDEYQQRYKKAIDKRFEDSAKQKTKELSISDLE